MRAALTGFRTPAAAGVIASRWKSCCDTVKRKALPTLMGLAGITFELLSLKFDDDDEKTMRNYCIGGGFFVLFCSASFFAAQAKRASAPLTWRNPYDAATLNVLQYLQYVTYQGLVHLPKLLKLNSTEAATLRSFMVRAINEPDTQRLLGDDDLFSRFAAELSHSATELCPDTKRMLPSGRKHTRTCTEALVCFRPEGSTFTLDQDLLHSMAYATRNLDTIIHAGTRLSTATAGGLTVGDTLQAALSTIIDSLAVLSSSPAATGGLEDELQRLLDAHQGFLEHYRNQLLPV